MSKLSSREFKKLLIEYNHNIILEINKREFEKKIVDTGKISKEEYESYIYNSKKRKFREPFNDNRYLQILCNSLDDYNNNYGLSYAIQNYEVIKSRVLDVLENLDSLSIEYDNKQITLYKYDNLTLDIINSYLNLYNLKFPSNAIKQKVLDDIQVVYEDDKWIVVLPNHTTQSISAAASYWNEKKQKLIYDNTFDHSKGYGQKTGKMNWCTSVTYDSNAWLSHSLNLDLYYVIKKNTRSINDKYRKICISLSKIKNSINNNEPKLEIGNHNTVDGNNIPINSLEVLVSVIGENVYKQIREYCYLNEYERSYIKDSNKRWNNSSLKDLIVSLNNKESFDNEKIYYLEIKGLISFSKDSYEMIKYFIENFFENDRLFFDKIIDDNTINNISYDLAKEYEYNEIIYKHFINRFLEINNTASLIQRYTSLEELFKFLISKKDKISIVKLINLKGVSISKKEIAYEIFNLFNYFDYLQNNYVDNFEMFIYPIMKILKDINCPKEILAITCLSWIEFDVDDDIFEIAISNENCPLDIIAYFAGSDYQNEYAEESLAERENLNSDITEYADHIIHLNDITVDNLKKEFNYNNYINESEIKKYIKILIKEWKFKK